MDMKERRAKIAQITAKAWSDPAFKKQLLENPAAVMQAHGIEVPSGMNVRIHENTATTRNVILPHKAEHLTPNDLNNPDRMLPLQTNYCLELRSAYAP